MVCIAYPEIALVKLKKSHCVYEMMLSDAEYIYSMRLSSSLWYGSFGICGIAILFLYSLFTVCLYFHRSVVLAPSFQRMPFFKSFSRFLLWYLSVLLLLLLFILLFVARFFSLSDCFHIIFDSFLSHYSFSELRCFFIHFVYLFRFVSMCLTLFHRIHF